MSGPERRGKVAAFGRAGYRNGGGAFLPAGRPVSLKILPGRRDADAFFRSKTAYRKKRGFRAPARQRRFFIGGVRSREARRTAGTNLDKRNNLTMYTCKNGKVMNPS